MTTKIQFDGRTLTVSKEFSFEGSHGGELMKARGWEPRWYMVGRKAFLRSSVDGAFFPHTAPTTPEVAPGWRKP